MSGRRGLRAYTSVSRALLSTVCFGAMLLGVTACGGETPGGPEGRVFWTSVDAGLQHTCGVSENGEAFCWGRNLEGQLGDGTRESTPRPVLVSGGLRFKTVRAGGNTSCGLTDAGELYCWGENTFGQLGDGTTDDGTVSVLVAGNLDFTTVSPAFWHTCGVVGSGVAYWWGQNTFGQLGDGSAESRMTPGRVLDPLS